MFYHRLVYCWHVVADLYHLIVIRYRMGFSVTDKYNVISLMVLIIVMVVLMLMLTFYLVLVMMMLCFVWRLELEVAE